MSGGGVRRRPVIRLTVFAALLIAGLTWRGRTADVPGAVAAVVPAPAVRVGAPWPDPSPPRPPPIGPTAPNAHGPDERQICGGAWVRIGADGQIEGEPPDSADEVAAARRQTIARLRADRDEYARAVAAWMDDDGGAALVELAVGTHDPRVYALAFQSCRAAGAVASCSLLNAGQWARLDAGNAAPWLFLLADAAARKDPTRVDEALFQIGAAARSDNGAFRPLLPILDGAPVDDRSVLPTFGVTAQALGKALAVAIPTLTPLVAACRGAALADANRRQVCERVGDVLTDRSDDLVTRAIGARIVTNVTGSSERYERQRAERDVWAAANPAMGTPDPLEALGCRNVRGLLDRLGAQALHGEAGAVRDWVAQSGLTDKDILDRARADDARRRADAPTAASGPP